MKNTKEKAKFLSILVGMRHINRKKMHLLSWKILYLQHERSNRNNAKD